MVTVAIGMVVVSLMVITPLSMHAIKVYDRKNDFIEQENEADHPRAKGPAALRAAASAEEIMVQLDGSVDPAGEEATERKTAFV